jgi:hypothetical protein
VGSAVLLSDGVPGLYEDTLFAGQEDRLGPPGAKRAHEDREKAIWKRIAADDSGAVLARVKAGAEAADGDQQGNRTEPFGCYRSADSWSEIWRQMSRSQASRFTPAFTTGAKLNVICRGYK